MSPPAIGAATPTAHAAAVSPGASRSSGPGELELPLAQMSAGGQPPSTVSRSPVTDAPPGAPSVSPEASVSGAPPPLMETVSGGASDATPAANTRASSAGTDATNELPETASQRPSVPLTIANAPAPLSHPELEMTLAEPPLPPETHGADEATSPEPSGTLPASSAPNSPSATAPAAAVGAPAGAGPPPPTPAPPIATIARTAAVAPPPLAATPELTLQEPGAKPAGARRRFDPLRILRRTPIPETAAGRGESRSLPSQPLPVAGFGGAAEPDRQPATEPASAPASVSRTTSAASDAPELTLATSAGEGMGQRAADFEPVQTSPSTTATNAAARPGPADFPEMPSGQDVSRTVATPRVATPDSTGERAAGSLPVPASVPNGSAMAPDLTLQRSNLAAPLAPGATPRAVDSPTTPVPEGSAPSETELTLSRPTATETQPSASAPVAADSAATPVTAPLPATAAGGAAPGFASLELAAPPTGGSRSPTTVTAGTEGSAAGPTLNPAIGASAPSAPFQRSLDSPNQPEAALTGGPAPTVAAQGGPGRMTGDSSLELVSPQPAIPPAGLSPGNALEPAVRRAAATGIPLIPSLPPAAPTVKAHGAGPVLDGAPAHLDLAAVGSANPAADQPTEAMPVVAQPLASHSAPLASPSTEIARAIVTPEAGRPSSDLPLSVPAAPARAAANATPQIGAIARATAFAPPAGARVAEAPNGLQLTVSRLPSSHGAETGRAVVPSQSSPEPGSAAARLDQPLVVPESRNPAERGGVPGSLARDFALPDPQPQQLQRRPAMPLSIEPQPEAMQRASSSEATEAFGAITSIQRAADEPAESQEISEANLEQITEHVWQFVRKELRVERERQRGQA